MFKVGDEVQRKTHRRFDGGWNHKCASLNKEVDGPFKITYFSMFTNKLTLDGMPGEWSSVDFWPYKESETPSDMVKSPKHYEFFPGVEAIQIIARSMTEDQFKGYCMGNALKYRLRAGKKFNTEEDLKKADQYITLFDKYRHCCLEEDI